MRLGVIADTHGWLDPAVLEVFRGVDQILAAGDIGAMAVVSGLAAVAPVLAVRGNNDERGECAGLPDEIGVELEGWRLRLSHYRQRAVIESDVAVFGHSHRALWSRTEERYLLNPGAAARRGFHTERKVAILELATGTEPQCTHILLGPRSMSAGPGSQTAE
jgi:putative phosphoesterase